MDAELALDCKQQKKQLRLHIKEQVQRLYNKRLFYSHNHPEWKELRSKALHYKKTFCKDKDPIRAANRMITDQFKHCIDPKQNGRPQKYKVKNINAKVLEFILKVTNKKVTQLAMDRTTFWRRHKQVVATKMKNRTLKRIVINLQIMI